LHENEQKKKKRSKNKKIIPRGQRLAILSDKESQFVKGKWNLIPKKRSEFYLEFEKRFRALLKDLELIHNDPKGNMRPFKRKIVFEFGYKPEHWIATFSINEILNHGLSTGALFLLVGMIYERTHTRKIADYGGIAKIVPFFSFALLFTSLSSIGLPGLNGFIGEFLILVGSFKSTVLGSWWFTVFAATGVIFAAVYLLWMYKKVVIIAVALSLLFISGLVGCSRKSVNNDVPIHGQKC